ncbi:MAG TPA: DUF5676 family membrane protein [Vicinamibacterales bacterium]|nr:DUF5676 family membrane protein [Vicinamibacterales bacterium]
MNKLDPWRTGVAVALTAAIVSIICALAVYLFPQGTVEFVNSWTHGLDLTLLRSDRPMTPGSVLSGLFNVSLTGFLIGTLFAWARNLIGHGKSIVA